MKGLFDKVSYKSSVAITHTYSTSFSLGVRLLHKSLRRPIYNIYGFVRLADEIVDSFHDYDKEALLDEFEKSYYRSLKDGISINPILNAFQHTVKQYSIDDELIQAFLKSMRRDLHKSSYTAEEYKEYIYGSADAVGLMCLRVFVEGDEDRFQKLKPYAMRLGSAFQKVNFLRDLKSDTKELHRFYFPILQEREIDDQIKRELISEIKEDFNFAVKGIRMLPKKARLGVFTAYFYYLNLLYKIEKLPAQILMNERIRISNLRKILLAIYSYISYELKLI